MRKGRGGVQRKGTLPRSLGGRNTLAAGLAVFISLGPTLAMFVLFITVDLVLLMVVMIRLILMVAVAMANSHKGKGGGDYRDYFGKKNVPSNGSHINW